MTNQNAPAAWTERDAAREEAATLKAQLADRDARLARYEAAKEGEPGTDAIRACIAGATCGSGWQAQANRQLDTLQDRVAALKVERDALRSELSEWIETNPTPAGLLAERKRADEAEAERDALKVEKDALASRVEDLERALRYIIENASGNVPSWVITKAEKVLSTLPEPPAELRGA